ncbi:unnamed protein product, partial [Amoebophrya sp. A25]|eukprot:GSA25T00012405001.1
MKVENVDAAGGDTDEVVQKDDEADALNSGDSKTGAAMETKDHNDVNDHAKTNRSP